MSGSIEQQKLAGEWLKYAEGDLKSAKALNAGEDLPLRNACYLAQQSVENY